MKRHLKTMICVMAFILSMPLTVAAEEPVETDTGNEIKEEIDVENEEISVADATDEMVGNVVASGKCGDNANWSFDGETLTISGTGKMDDWESLIAPWHEYYHLSIKNVVIEAGITSIGKNAFNYDLNLTDVKIPDGVTSIGERAFSECRCLKSVMMPDTVASIDAYAFENCYSLADVHMSSGVTEIKYGAFSDCSSLTEITLPSGITSLDGTFSGCTNLSSITIPDGVTEIGDSAFRSCNSITEIRIPDKVKTIGHYAFMGCDKIEKVTLSRNLTTIEGEAFYHCNSLKEITIPSSVNSISFQAFGYTDDGMYFGMWVKGFKIYGVEGSAAQTYAKTNNIEFVPISKDEADKSSFTDVPSGKYYTDAVTWAVSKGITTGTGNNQFSPDKACSRGQVVTFLWRAYGSPEPTTTTSKFTDVQDPEKYYYKAVLWAVEKGITAGTSATTFSPDATVTRGQFVTFIYRAEGKPAVTGASKFTDVNDLSKFYYYPVIWAVDKGVTNGTSATTFSPIDSCTRGQVVTFLYRDLK